MDDKKIWLGAVAFICLCFGLAKVIRPRDFVKQRRPFAWFDIMDLWSIMFRSAYAEHAVRINGVLLLLISAGLFGWIAFG